MGRLHADSTWTCLLLYLGDNLLHAYHRCPEQLAAHPHALLANLRCCWAAHTACMPAQSAAAGAAQRAGPPSRCHLQGGRPTHRWQGRRGSSLGQCARLQGRAVQPAGPGAEADAAPLAGRTASRSSRRAAHDNCRIEGHTTHGIQAAQIQFHRRQSVNPHWKEGPCCIAPMTWKGKGPVTLAAGLPNTTISPRKSAALWWSRPDGAAPPAAVSCRQEPQAMSSSHRSP